MAESLQNTLVLYVGDHCPLCDKAKGVIYPLLQGNWCLKEVNITDDVELQRRYATRVPVVAVAGGKEKGWPFSAGQIRRLMEGPKSSS